MARKKSRAKWRGKIISTLTHVRKFEREAEAAAERTTSHLRKFIREDGISFFRHIKFDWLGHSPVEVEKALNIFEQANQTFTWLVALKGVRMLLKQHPGAGPFHVAYPTQGGPDIRSEDKSLVLAEVFAKIGADFKHKVRIDIGRLRYKRARYKYVFFCSQDYNKTARHKNLEAGGVHVWSVKV